MKRLPVLCVVLATLFFNHPSANADLVIGNLPATSDTTLSAGLNNLRVKAIRFTMGNDAYDVDNVILRLANYGVAGEAFAQIRDFNGSTTSVGTTTLLSFTPSAPGGAPAAEYTFTASSAFTLQANTSYWLVVGGIAGQAFDWRATTSTTSDPYVGPATFNNGLFTTNGGTSWSASASRNYFQLNGSQPIPEPATAWLLAGLAGVSVFRRRR